MRWRHHVARGTRVWGADGFVPGIPVCFEGGAFGFLSCSLMICPPGFELCIPAFRVCCAPGFDVFSPCYAVSEYCHCEPLFICFLVKFLRLRYVDPIIC